MVEKLLIFGVQEGVLLKRGAWKSKIESSTASIERLSPPRYALSDFYRTAMSLITPSSRRIVPITPEEIKNTHGRKKKFFGRIK